MIYDCTCWSCKMQRINATLLRVAATIARTTVSNAFAAWPGGIFSPPSMDKTDPRRWFDCFRSVDWRESPPKVWILAAQIVWLRQERVDRLQARRSKRRRFLQALRAV